MKIILLFIALLANQVVFPQAAFTTFVEKRPVIWAAVTDDTVHFNHPNLSHLLREALSKGKIKAKIIEEDEQAAITAYASKEAIQNRIAPHRQQEVMDADGNRLGTIIEAEDPLFSTRYFDSLSNDLVEVKQIWYIQSGRFRSYIAWVSPKHTVYTSWGQRLGLGKSFTTAFNPSRGIPCRVKKRAVALGTTRSRIPLHPADPPLKMLKQLYGQNLWQALWPLLNKKHYLLYRADSSQPITTAGINSRLLEAAPVSIPEYDSLGMVHYKTVPPLPLNIVDLSYLEAEQEWYYDQKKNRLYNTTRQLILYAKKWKDGQPGDTESAILKIVIK